MSMVVLVDVRSGGTLSLRWNGARGLEVKLTLEAMNATAHVHAVDDAGLKELTEELSHNWQGWRGAKEWASLEDDLRLRFAHDGAGMVNLGITLRRFVGEAWEVKAGFTVDPASLERLAQDVRTLFEA